MVRLDGWEREEEEEEVVVPRAESRKARMLRVSLKLRNWVSTFPGTEERTGTTRVGIVPAREKEVRGGERVSSSFSSFLSS